MGSGGPGAAESPASDERFNAAAGEATWKADEAMASKSDVAATMTKVCDEIDAYDARIVREVRAMVLVDEVGSDVVVNYLFLMTMISRPALDRLSAALEQPVV